MQPSELASTVFPCGVRLLASLAPPTYYSNCLTKENGARVAVHCLRFVAEVPQELLSIVRMRLGVTLYTSAAADAETDVLAHLLRRPIYSHYVVAVVTRATGLQLTIRAALEAFAHAIPAGTVPTREHLAGLHAALVPRPSVRQSRPGLVLRVGDIEFPLPPPALHVWRMPRSSVRCRSCGIAAREARCSLCDMCPTCAVSTQQGEMDSVTRAPSIRPCVMGLPVADVNFRALFAALDVGNVLQLFAALLTGRSTLLVSSSLTRLGDCSAALLALMWPLEYCAAHIGIAYEGMSPEYIHTLCDVESQTLFGVHRDLGEAIARVSPFTAALTVDLDRNTVTVPPELPVHRLPARYALRLFRRVLRHANLFRFYHPSHVIAPLQLPFEASPVCLCVASPSFRSLRLCLCVPAPAYRVAWRLCSPLVTRALPPQFEVAMAEKLAKRAMLHSHDSATSALADLASHRDFPAAASPASPASPAPSAPATHAAASLALSSDLKRWMHAPAAHAAGFAAAQPAGDVDRSLLSVRARSSTTLDVPTKARGVRWAPTARYRTVSQLPAPELRLALAADPAREAIVKASPRRQCASPREVRPVDEELRLACTLYSSEEEGDEHEGEGEDGGEGGPEAEAGAGAVVTLADPAVDAAAAVAAMRPLAGDAAAAHHRTEAALRAQREWERWQCFLQPPVYLPDGADEEEADWPLADPVRPLSVFRAAANGVPLLRRSSSSLGEGAQLRGAGWLGRASRRVRAFSKHVIRRTSALTSCLRIDCTPGTRTPFGVPTVPEAPADAADADAVAAEAADAAADSPLPFFLADAAAALGGESALQDFRQRLHQRFGSLRPLHPRDKAGYRKLSAEEVEELCKAGLRLLEAVPQGDHLSAVSSQPCVDTFMGREAITTMLLCGLARTPADAEALARRMIAAGIIQHVGNAPAFGHGHLYHFTEVFRKVMEPVIRFRQQGGGWHRRQPSRPRSVRATAAGHGGEARPHVHAAAATPQLQELLRTPASGGVDTSASAALSAEAANHAVSADATTGTCAAAADMLAHAPTDAAAGTAVAAPLTRADVADEGSDLGSLDPTDFVPAAWEPPFSEQGVRNAFCAVIVSIFKGYRPYLTIPDAARLAAGADSAASQAVSPDASPHALPLSTHDLFDRKRFMQEQVPPDANVRAGALCIVCARPAHCCDIAAVCRSDAGLANARVLPAAAAGPQGERACDAGGKSSY